jgi:DNA-binding NarL/FixJ family response regulator
MEPYRIVLADDHVLIRQGLAGLINGVADLEVIGEAGDGIELLALLQTVTAHFIILDISMPNLRGIEVVYGIKKKYPSVKILILTMHKDYLNQAMSAGADGYLLKEDADRDLFSAIDNIRQGRPYVSPRLEAELLGNRAPSSEQLSAREKEVLNLIAKGTTNKKIAGILHISVRTVEFHRAAILKKLNLKNTADLVRYAIQKGYA